MYRTIIRSHYIDGYSTISCLEPYSMKKTTRKKIVCHNDFTNYGICCQNQYRGSCYNLFGKMKPFQIPHKVWSIKILGYGVFGEGESAKTQKARMINESNKFQAQKRLCHDTSQVRKFQHPSGFQEQVKTWGTACIRTDGEVNRTGRKLLLQSSACRDRPSWGLQ